MGEKDKTDSPAVVDGICVVTWIILTEGIRVDGVQRSMQQPRVSKLEASVRHRVSFAKTVSSVIVRYALDHESQS